jgi:hypothetical protein
MDNLCHMDRSTGATYTFSNRRIISKIAKDFNIRWNFPNALEEYMESISESNDRRTLAANILTTNSTIPLFCRLLWTEILNL